MKKEQLFALRNFIQFLKSKYPTSALLIDDGENFSDLNLEKELNDFLYQES